MDASRRHGRPPCRSPSRPIATLGRAVDGWKRQNDSLRTMFASVLFEPVPLRLLPTSVAAPKGGASSRVVAAPPHREPKALPGSVRPSGLVATTMVGVALVAFAAGALASFGTDDFGLSPRSGQAVAAEEVSTPPEDRELHVARPRSPPSLSVRSDKARGDHGCGRTSAGALDPAQPWPAHSVFRAFNVRDGH